MTSFITDGKDWLNCPWIQLIKRCVEVLKPLVVEHCDVCSSAKLMVVSWYQQAIPRNIKTCQNCKDINLWTSICRNRSTIFLGLMMLIISRDVHLFVNWYVYVRNGEQIKTFPIYAPETECDSCTQFHYWANDMIMILINGEQIKTFSGGW